MCQINLRHSWAPWAILAALAVPAVGAPPPAPRVPSQPLRQFQTPYYIIYTDLGDKDELREAAVRMTAMAEEYYERTKGFTGVIRTRLPFYLYGNEASYIAAGGLPDTVGVFTGDKLMAIVPEGAESMAWRTIQHEGFHQFVEMVIGGQMPIWVNEGLAEYFGAAVYTGDGFVSGVIPSYRLRRVQARMRAKEFLPLEDMMMMPHSEWNSQLEVTHYDQAWSMVHFLAHAEDGKYQKPFEAFIRAVGSNKNWKAAWKQIFGTDVQAFQKRWADWWLALPAKPTADLYAKAVVATMTSYLARATLQQKSFDTMDEFLEAVTRLKLPPDFRDWLPPSLLTDTLPAVRVMGDWTIIKTPKEPPQLRCQLKRDGAVFVGSFTLKAGHVLKVTVRQTVAASQPNASARKS